MQLPVTLSAIVRLDSKATESQKATNWERLYRQLGEELITHLAPLPNKPALTYKVRIYAKEEHAAVFQDDVIQLGLRAVVSALDPDQD